MSECLIKLARGKKRNVQLTQRSEWFSAELRFEGKNKINHTGQVSTAWDQTGQVI